MSSNGEEQAATMERPSEEPVAVAASFSEEQAATTEKPSEEASAFSEEQEALVLSAWDAMRGDSAAIALKFFLRYSMNDCSYILPFDASIHTISNNTAAHGSYIWLTVLLVM